MTYDHFAAILNELPPEVVDCLVFLHNTRGRFPSYNVIDKLSPALRGAVRREAERRAEEVKG